MPNLTITMPADLKAAMSQHDEVNWSGVIRKAIQEHLHRIEIADAIAAKSKLTDDDVKELDKLIKRGVAKQHGLA
jgi:uncharacterized protein YqeY